MYFSKTYTSLGCFMSCKYFWLSLSRYSFFLTVKQLESSQVQNILPYPKNLPGFHRNKGREQQWQALALNRTRSPIFSYTWGCQGAHYSLFQHVLLHTVLYRCSSSSSDTLFACLAHSLVATSVCFCLTFSCKSFPCWCLNTSFPFLLQH